MNKKTGIGLAVIAGLLLWSKSKAAGTPGVQMQPPSAINNATPISPPASTPPVGVNLSTGLAVVPPAASSGSGSGASTNPATSTTVVPWTSNPTPGEIQLQQQYALATQLGQNLASISESAFGPAWSIMIVSQAQWNSLTPAEQSSGNYSTDGLARVQAMRAYWIANNPGQPVPTMLTDAYYYATLQNDNGSNLSSVPVSQSALLSQDPSVNAILEQILANPSPAEPVTIPTGSVTSTTTYVPPSYTAPVAQASPTNGVIYDVNPYSPTYGQPIGG